MSHRLTVLCVEKTSLFSGSEVGALRQSRRNVAGDRLAMFSGSARNGNMQIPATLNESNVDHRVVLLEPVHSTTGAGRVPIFLRVT